jgi:glycosyltransferase involved in cell wall biosynthesis
MSKSLKISVITATFNSEKNISVLIKSLSSQTDKNFEWIVADGGSEDKTLTLVRSIEGVEFEILNGPDFGIYDALNKAIKECRSDYYIVAGSDDEFSIDAIEKFRQAATGNADIIAAWVTKGAEVIKPRHSKPVWLVSQKKYISSHSLATMIKKSVHDKVGYYTKRFPIAADQKFIMDVCYNSRLKIEEHEFVAGIFGLSGVSSSDLIGVITEFYRVQIDSGMNKYIQLALLVYKLIFIAYKNEKK